MEFDKILDLRKSVRAYLKKNVPRELLVKLVTAASQAPSACNLQLTRYLILDDSKIIKDLADEVSYKFSWAPAYILVLYDSRFTKERRAGATSAAMAAQNILLKATEIGFSTCAMTGFGNDNFLKKKLSIPKYLDILLLISVGYEDLDDDKESVFHLPVEKIFSFNSFGGLAGLNPSANLSEHSIQSVIDYRSRISGVYLDRFHLQSFKDRYYELALNQFLQSVLPQLPKDSVMLDVLSYDGYFLKKLFDKTKVEQKVYASDYLDNTLSFLEKTLSIFPVKINLENKFVGLANGSIDAATFIFNLSFIPKLDLVIADLCKKMKKEGIIYCVIFNESWYRRATKFSRNLWLKLMGRQVNVYENNPFYKIGPYRHISKSRILKIFKENGFLINKFGIFSNNIKEGTKLYYFMFKKQ